MIIRFQAPETGWWPFKTVVAISVFTDNVEYVVDMKKLQNAGKIVLHREGATIRTVSTDGRNRNVLSNDKIIASCDYRYGWCNSFALVFNGHAYRVDPAAQVLELSSDLDARWRSNEEVEISNVLDYDVAAYLGYQFWSNRKYG